MIHAVVLDTTVASLLHPRRKDLAIRNWYERRLRDKSRVLSFQSVAELWRWAVENQWSTARRRQLERYIRGYVVIPYDVALAKRGRTSVTFVNGRVDDSKRETLGSWPLHFTVDCRS